MCKERASEDHPGGPGASDARDRKLRLSGRGKRRTSEENGLFKPCTHNALKAQTPWQIQKSGNLNFYVNLNVTNY